MCINKSKRMKNPFVITGKIPDRFLSLYIRQLMDVKYVFL